MELREGNVVWTFADDVLASKYDDWQFYREHFVGCVDAARSDHSATKAVDIVAYYDERDDTLWLIEAKDFTSSKRDADKEPLPVEVARKVRDTLAGLMAAARLAHHDQERQLARLACQASKLRVVLHIEQPTNPSKLTPRSYDMADLKQKLRQLLRRRVEDHPIVMDCQMKQERPELVPWEVRWAPLQADAQATPPATPSP